MLGNNFRNDYSKYTINKIWYIRKCVRVTYDEHYYKFYFLDYIS